MRPRIESADRGAPGLRLGIAAGFFGGRIDTLLMRLTDYFISIPDVPLMIVLPPMEYVIC